MFPSTSIHHWRSTGGLHSNKLSQFGLDSTFLPGKETRAVPEEVCRQECVCFVPKQYIRSDAGMCIECSLEIAISFDSKRNDCCCKHLFLILKLRSERRFSENSSKWKHRHLVENVDDTSVQNSLVRKTRSCYRVLLQMVAFTGIQII